MTWTLMATTPGPGEDEAVFVGTEEEVKAEAQRMVDAAPDADADAALRCDLYLEKPDGKSHQDQSEGDGYFTRGEPIEWIDVEW